MTDERRLTRREFEEVIRRAADLASAEPDPDQGSLDEAELFRIAGEVGLPARHVRRALAEVRSGRVDEGLLDAVWGSETVRASRVVPGTPRELAARLDDFMVATQLLQPVRRGPERLQYRPAVDWASQIARAASGTSGRYYVASAKRVEVRLEPVSDDSVLVTFEVDAGTRNDYLLGGVLGGGAAGAGAGFGVATLLTAAPVLVTAGAAVLSGGAVAAGVVWLTGRSHRKKLWEVRAEVEGVLERLESGESLEPPPPSWRRWVRRHFHGVARDVLGDE
ncbi:MAG: hypothetical protein GWM92_18355 [Gemmatimonadetes bacterium]|nr:hypothetical protein [Gemmatimonadota bacterium]NIR80765.1 hypothetical protein [Gemmatimonadota bacterium]NIT89582.1 hypothetical protein [Gemmatimonadota bacterium]NIU33365.1 hypothetical protein [Gemmatimonadota bacterium]NIU37654.1 hypothetical protein [Gemmatimonadota bacterium]